MPWRPLPPFCLSFCLLGAADGIVVNWDQTVVHIGCSESAESVLLSEIAAELVRAALAIPDRIGPIPTSTEARQRLRDNEIDVCFETLASLTADVARDQDQRGRGLLRRTLDREAIRMTEPLGGDFVMLFRADLPPRASPSVTALMKMQELVTPGVMHQLLARTRNGVPAATVAAEFVREKIDAGRHARQPPRLRVTLVLLPAAVLTLVVIWGTRQRRPGP